MAVAQEEEVLSVQGHLQDAMQAASLAAGGKSSTSAPVASVAFYKIWKATNGFSQSCAAPISHTCCNPRLCGGLSDTKR
jgi:hypothetical protein